MKEDQKTCAWHECATEFEPDHPQQDFCRPDCRNRMSWWLKARGARVVRFLLDPNWKRASHAVKEERSRLIKEVEDAKALAKSRKKS